MRNELFIAKETELENKYYDRIFGISLTNSVDDGKTLGVDMGVAFEMFLANAEKGAGYQGGGECTAEEWTEILEDVKALRALGRK